jgi:hypothetical protein
MAKHSSASLAELEPGFVLSPERYDPSRRLLIESNKTLSDCVELVNVQVSPKTADPAKSYLVLDTGDAREGVILTNRSRIPGSEIGSAKKLLQPGDVIISRLRPYLRQVAFIDDELGRGADQVVCSTEFYVLRQGDDERIAYLVPWLLSSPVQGVLAAAQEGGHHPRFNAETLETLPVPEELWKQRISLAQEVEAAVASARSSELSLRRLTAEAGSITARLSSPQ